MVTPFFDDIRKTLIKAFSEAKISLDIAVAWFTNEQIYNIILKKLEKGLRVRLVMINDDINHCSGLNLQY